MALPTRTLPLSLKTGLSPQACAARVRAMAEPSPSFMRMHHRLTVENPESGPAD